MAVLIRDGRVLAGAPAALHAADLLIEGDRIAAVGPGLTAPPGAREIDAAGRIVLPGLGNAHTHAGSHLARGRARNWTLEVLLTYSQANSGFRTPEDEYLSAAIGAIEMLKTGCTSAYDLYVAVPAITDEAFEAVVRAYTDLGVRVVLAPAVADVVFYQTVPELSHLLPPDLRRVVEEIAPAPTKGLVFLRPLADPVKALVYAETGAGVDTVLVDGRVVVEGGRVTTVDEARIYARAQEAADRQRARGAAAWALAERLAPYVAAACRGAVAAPLPINRFAASLPPAR